VERGKTGEEEMESYGGRRRKKDEEKGGEVQERIQRERSPLPQTGCDRFFH